ncbi:MAG: hypothetical protein AB7F99_14940 [Vicinamibacterales bacterium]
MGLLDRLSTRRSEPGASPARTTQADESVFATKALPKFLAALTSREQPVLLDLGPVVGPNVNFFGEQLGCKILVEDIFADLERHARGGRLEHFAQFLGGRLRNDPNSIDGILCWDLFDYLDRPAADTLASQLTKILRPAGALFGMFATAAPKEPTYNKFTIVDETNLRYKANPAARGRRAVLNNRDIQRMFDGLRVAESFLLKNQLREMLFRKPA